MVNLKNINFMSEERFNSLTETSEDELYAVETDWLLDNKITNCLIHIPQDIKLELNDGTLTLKAGSKVWFPYGTTEAYQVGDIDAQGNTVIATSWDGSKFFYAIELQGDVSFSSGAPAINANQRMLVYNQTHNSFGWQITSLCKTTSSSDTFTDSALYYNTNSNVIKTNNNQSSGDKYSLPICLFTAATTAGVVDSIDQIFNGFGYIGSTVFALPGVRGLTPNGRNADGSLKNEEWITNNVITRTFTNTGSNHLIALNPNEPIEGYLFGTISMSNFYYNLEENRNYNLGGNEEWRFTPIVLDVTLTSGVISNFNPKTTFQAVDVNDVEKTHQLVSALPSNPDENVFYYIPE